MCQLGPVHKFEVLAKVKLHSRVLLVLQRSLTLVHFVFEKAPGVGDDLSRVIERPMLRRHWLLVLQALTIDLKRGKLLDSHRVTFSRADTSLGLDLSDELVQEIDEYVDLQELELTLYLYLVLY